MLSVEAIGRRPVDANRAGMLMLYFVIMQAFDEEDRRRCLVIRMTEFTRFRGSLQDSQVSSNVTLLAT